MNVPQSSLFLYRQSPDTSYYFEFDLIGTAAFAPLNSMAFHTEVAINTEFYFILFIAPNAIDCKIKLIAMRQCVQENVSPVVDQTLDSMTNWMTYRGTFFGPGLRLFFFCSNAVKNH
jgi:hypothetical protein